MVGPLTWIKKGTLTVVAKVWWTMVRHKLIPMNRDNVISFDKVSLVAAIMEGYEIDVTKIIEIYN